MNSILTPRRAGLVSLPRPVILLALLFSVSSPPARWLVPGATAQASEKAKETAVKRVKAPPRTPVPLTGGTLIFMPSPGGTGKVIATNAPTSIVFESSGKQKFEGLETLRAQKYLNSSMVIKLADKKGDHHAVIEAFMVADDTDALMAKVNASQPAFFQSVTNYLSTLKVEDFDKPGSANLLRTRLLDLCRRELGAKLVHEIIITRRIYR